MSVKQRTQTKRVMAHGIVQAQNVVDHTAVVKLTRNLRGFKVVYGRNASSHNRQFVIEVIVPKGATVVSDGIRGTPKCRTDQMFVSSVPRGAQDLYSGHTSSYKWHEGQMHKPRRKLDLTQSACRSGLHFCLTKAAAKEW